MLVLVALLLSLCGVAFAESEKSLIGILVPAATDGWGGGVAYFAKKAADDMELNYILLTSSNAEEMSGRIEQLISLGAVAIVMSPQFVGMEVAVETALKNGIVIYSFDMPIDVSEQYAENFYQLTGDNYSMGEESAMYIAEKLLGEGKVVILDVPSSGNVAVERKAGFLTTIAEVAPGIEVIATVDTMFTRQNGLDAMAYLLATYDQIDAVFSMDDETSIGALQAILTANRTDVKVITGGGGCQEYFNMMLDKKYADIWVASATYSPSMILNCVENTVLILEGEEIDQLIVFPTTIVDKKNAVDFLDENTPY